MSASATTMAKLQEYRTDRLGGAENPHWYDNNDLTVPQSIVEALALARDEPDSMEALLFVLVTELRRETQGDPESETTA